MLKVEKIAAFLSVLMGEPPFFWGPPGQGKSTFMRESFGSAGYYVRTMRANTLLPHQIYGNQVADVENGVTKHLPPAWVSELNAKPKALIFLDDISCASQSIQTACLNILDEKSFQGVELKAIPVCAANPNEVGTPRFELDAALANRAIHISITSDASAFRADVLAKFQPPPMPKLHQDWQAHKDRYEDMVTRFLCEDGHGHLVNQMPTTVDRSTVAWPSERSWLKFCLIMSACESIDPRTLSGVSLVELKSTLLTGCVGEAAYQAFKGYFRKPIKLKLEDVLAKGSSFELPKEGDEIFGTLLAFEDFFEQKDNLTKYNLEKAWSLVEKCWRSANHKDRLIPFALQLAAYSGVSMELPDFYLTEVVNALDLEKGEDK